MEAHQHDDSCYTEELVCAIPESDGHQHTEACYSVSRILVCGKTDHRHGKSCYDADGNLVCGVDEHTHTDDCYKEQRELVCGLKESEGHRHTEDCYRKILTCGKESHTHSTECYKDTAASTVMMEGAAVASDESSEITEMDPGEEESSELETYAASENEDVFETGENGSAGEAASAFTEEDQFPGEGDRYSEEDQLPEEEDRALEEDGEIADSKTEEDADAADDEADEDRENESSQSPETDFSTDGEDGENGFAAEAEPAKDGEDGESGSGSADADHSIDGEEESESGTAEEGLSTEEDGEDGSGETDLAIGEAGEDGSGETDLAIGEAGEDGSGETDLAIGEAGEEDGSGEAADASGTGAADAETGDESVLREAGDQTGADSADTSAAAESETADSAETAAESEIASTAGTEAHSADPSAAAKEGYVPVLDQLHFARILNKKTAIYYSHAADQTDVSADNQTDGSADGAEAALFDTAAQDGQEADLSLSEGTAPDPAADWKKVNKDTEDTELAPADLLRVYLAYTIPAGELNETNAVARYRLPSGLHLTDDQIRSINTTVNGIAAQYVDYDKLEILDVEAYNKYLGIEAVEGTRRPSDDIREYLEKNGQEEYISATVKAENVYNEISGELEGQDLIFTFAPYTVMKNRHEYDAEGKPVKAGEKVRGWVCLDLTTDQVDWKTSQITTEEIKNEAAPEGISQEEAHESAEEAADAETPEGTGQEEAQEPAEEAADAETPEGTGQEEAQEPAEEAADSETQEDAAALETEKTEEVTADAEKLEADTEAEAEKSDTAAGKMVTIRQVEEKTAEIVFAEEDKELGIDEISSKLRMILVQDLVSEEAPASDSEETAENAGTKDKETSGEKTSEDKAAGENTEDNRTGENAGNVNPADYPAATFDDRITVTAGSLNSDTETGSSPEKVTELKVHVEADEGTFPAGTTMRLAEADPDVVAAALEGSVEGRTKGFHAVDISFWSAPGDDSSTEPVEIEPLKPIRVSITSEAIRQAVEDSSTAPLVVHVEDSADKSDKENKTDKSDEADAADKADKSDEADIADIADKAVKTQDTAEAKNVETEEDEDTLTFEADSFSVYAVVYTVDFHWEVNGKVYDFSIPGGGFVSLEHLVEVLGIVESDSALNSAISAEDSENEEGSASEDTVSLNNLPVSEQAKQFVEDVQSVESSNLDLVWIGKADNETTVGGLKEANGLESNYSAELTEEQIAEINAQTVKSGDWALISLQPFTSEEALTVTMKNGGSFKIRLTDAVIPSSSLVEGNRYILYAANSSGQYFALRGDGYCYRVPNNDLDSLGDEYLWRYHYVSDGWAAGTCEWFSQNDENQIELWWTDTTAVNNEYGSYIQLQPAPNGGYYFITDNGGYGKFGLWLYSNVYSYPQSWSFRSGNANQYNRSEIFIYEKEPLHQYTVNVNNNDYGRVRLTDSTTAWVTSGQGNIDRNGKNAHYLEARANDGYWFDHWELDGQPVEETDNISDGWITQGTLNIGNEDGHVLTAVFVPETRFNVEVSPSGAGSVNVNTSPRTKDGYNKELISAAAANGWWFDHWEIDGVVAECDEETDEDGSNCNIPARGIYVGDGNRLTAVFIPKVTYDVMVASEEEGASTIGDCTVSVGEGTPAQTVTGNAINYAGCNSDSIMAVAGPGYVFKEWRIDGKPVLGGAVITNAPDGSFSTIDAGTLQIGKEEGHVITAVFAQEYTFTITTNPSGAGTVHDDNKPAGETVFGSMTKDGHNKYQITAAANSGYYFSHWEMNGQPLVDEESNYLYTNGFIPAGELTITSSDNICAVFVKGVYSITVKNDTHGSTSINNGYGSNKDEKTALTSNNANFEKQAANRIVASPDTNYKFAYWKVDYPETIVNWGNGYSATSSTIQPTVNTDTTLTAMFVNSSTRTYVVTVDDPSHGTVYGQKDVSGSNTSVYGATTFVGKVNGNNRNDGQIEIRTVSPGYEFVGWNVYYPNGSLYRSYETNNALKSSRINSDSVPIPQDGMVIKAIFREKPTPPAFEDDSMADLTEWANDIAGTHFTTDKRAEVFDYDNRIYRIDMSASSEKKAIDSSVVINFITDTSRSMYFPANITMVMDVENYTWNGDAFGQRINTWLTSTNQNRDNVYYAITSQNGNATMHAIYYSTQNNRWESVDASYYGPNADDGQTRAGSALTGLNIGDDPNNFYVYQAPPRVSGKPWSRLDYLVMSVETAVKTIYTICPNAQIDLTTFNRSASYRGTLPNDDATIEYMLRNIDVAGGTRQDLGLSTALPYFSNGSSKRQVAVLITDGTPNSGVSTISESFIREEAEEYAVQLKEITDADGNNLALYTMGISVKNVGSNESWLSGLSSGDDFAKSVETGEETSEAIKDIVNDLLNKVSLFGSMTDTVDPAFYPVDINGSPISEGIYAADGSVLMNVPTDNSAYYVWENNNGTWTITWYNQAFAWAEGDTPGWQKDFYIKAKEDFLGGNLISTNTGNNNGLTSSSYLKADTSTTPLSTPVTGNFDYAPIVNVDELHMEGNNTEWTVYLGTEVNPAEQIMYLLNQIPVKQVVRPGGTDDAGIYMTGAGQMYYPHDSSAVDNVDEAAPGKGASQTLPLSHYVDFTSANITQALQDALTQLGQVDEVTVGNIIYSEYGHAAGIFTITVKKDVNSEAAADGAPASHETKLVGDEVEKYTLTVKYTPYTEGAATTYEHTVPGGSSGQVTNGSGQNEVKSVNSHVINVIAKGVGIRKTDASTGESVSRKAEFKLYRALKTGETSETSLTIDGAQVPVVEVADLETGGQEGADRINNLPWYKAASDNYNGCYFLKETAAPEGYFMLSEPVVITVIPLDPQNQEQAAGITYVIDGETHEAEEKDGLMEVVVPNPPSGSLAIRKTVQTLGGVDIENMDGQYVFSVSGPADSAEQFTYYVYLDVENNEMTHYRLDKYAGLNAEAVVADRISTDEGDVDAQAVGCLISGIETGIYVLKEQYWNLSPDSTIPADEIYLRDIILDPATGGNTNDMFARTTSVLVTPDNPEDPELLKVTFVNEYAPDRYKFIVKKIWQDENGDPVSEPWDGSISTIEFSVTQTKNASSTSERESRQLTFSDGSDESSKLTIQLSGMCAMVSPTEPGSADYDLHWANGGDPWQTFISGLESTAPDGSPYTYTIEELCVRDVFGEIVTGYETTYDLSENGGSLIEEGGQAVGIVNINNGATAYINNKKIVEAGLNLKKIVEVSTDAPMNGDLTLTNGTYSFTVTGPEGAETPSTWYVNLIATTVNNGTEASPDYSTTYTYQIGSTEAERDAMEPVAAGSDGVPITLAPGKYTITEGEWSIDSSGGIMSLKDIDISSGSNNETDLSQRETVVYIGEGEIGNLEVAFTNLLKPYPGIRIIKIDETTRPEATTTTYLSGAEFQILKWDGSRYQVYPDAADSTVVTDNDGVAVFNGIEPGEYKIAETVTPPGYIKPEANDIFIKVTYNDATGLHTITRYQEAYTGDDSDARTVVAETENLLAITYVQATDAENPAAFTVGNTPGAALPNSGGPGTRLFTILGSILILGAGVLLWRRRRLI